METFVFRFVFVFYTRKSERERQGLWSALWTCVYAMRRTRAGQEGGFEGGVKQNNMSKNKCTRDISGIFFKWNISLLLATANKNSQSQRQAVDKQGNRDSGREWGGPSRKSGGWSGTGSQVRRLICHFFNDFCKAKHKQAAGWGEAGAGTSKNSPHSVESTKWHPYSDYSTRLCLLEDDATSAQVPQ